LTLLKILSHIAYGRPKGLHYLMIAAAVAVAAPAQAQIYTWTDANGHMVLSNKRPGSAAPSASYAVPKATGIRATRAAVPSRARAYDDLISEHSRTNGVRADLVRAVMQVESGFNPFARSPKGAMGLMQLMPATAKQYGVVNAFNPAENVRAGVAYLRELLDRYQNNEELALAAYNAGPGAVDKHGQTVPPYRETRDYVSRINKMSSPVVPVAGTTLYRVVDVTPDGREIPKYTDRKPR
jgi:soluble lytic murein transglycosylase-like protein